jgi:hypothetical protein
MSNPTTPFGWQMPENTDLVTNLPADFEVFGQAVATSMADLLGGTTGQILAKATNADMDFAWIANDQGDITGVTATSPLTGGGTSGAITIGIQDATTSVKGAVQLSDSTSTTSSVLASTPTAVKAAKDAADAAQTTATAAIAKTTVTTAGDIIYRNATVPTRLGIGTAGQILTVNSGATAPEWQTPSGSGGMTVIASGTLSGTSVVVSSIPNTYKNLHVVIYGATWDTSNDTPQLRYNSVTTNYMLSTYGYTDTLTSTTGGVTASGWNNNEGGNNWLRTGGQNAASWTIYNYTNTTGLINAIGSCSFKNTVSTFSRSSSQFSNQATPTAITSLTIRFGGGQNMTAGTYTVYGVS